MPAPPSGDGDDANVQSPTRRKHDEHCTTVVLGAEVERRVQLKMTSRKAVKKEPWSGDGAGEVGGEDEMSMIVGEEEDGDREVREARSLGG